MKISVRHAAVADTVVRLALTMNAFEHELDTLDSEVERLKSAWDGDAQRAYDRAQREWSATAISPQTAPTGPDRQEATEHDVQGAYTTLVVCPSAETLLCAEGNVYRSEKVASAS